MFTQGTFGPVSSHGNSNMPNIWTYRTDDSLEAIVADDYFINKHRSINDGDYIFVDLPDEKLAGQFRKTQNGFTIVSIERGTDGWKDNIQTFSSAKGQRNY